MSAPRTYWHLEGKRRVPSLYELESSKLLYYPERGFEVKTPGSAWFERYQRGTPLELGPLAEFRDPRETTYTSYVAVAREKEAFVDGLLRSASESGYDAKLAEEWLASLDRWFGVLLFPCHGLQMVTAYVAHLAPVSEVVIALAFQHGDEIRRVQRFAQRVAILRQTRADFGVHAREMWQSDPAWQPLRRVLEELLVTYDFGEALVRLLLVVKPLFDALFVQHASRLAETRQDPLLCRLLFSLDEDCRWHAQVTDELVRGLVRGAAPNRALIEGWVAAAYPAMRGALAALEPVWDKKLEAYAITLAALDAQVEKRWRGLGLDMRTMS
jgi:toluene monooxygenase system protein E